MKQKIKWGILGLGKIAHKFASDLQLSPDAIVQGVASRSITKARHFAKEYEARRLYGSYRDLIEDPEIDIIYIATPHTFHYEHTMNCLQHNKAVLCEKPIGVNKTEVEAMIQEAHRRRVFLMEGLWTHFIPITRQLIELLQNKAIGDILSVKADFGFQAKYDVNQRLYNKELGGGSLLDLGIYPLYMSYLALGQPTSVKALAHLAKTGVDSSCAVLLGHQNGALANLESTFEAETGNEAHFYGTKGWLKVHPPFHHSQQITMESGGKISVFKKPYQGHGYLHEIEEVQDCLLKGATQSAKLPLQTSLDLITTIDRVKDEIGLKYRG